MKIYPEFWLIGRATVRRRYVGFWLNLRAMLRIPGPWFCERCGRQWFMWPPRACPDEGGEIFEGTP